MKKLMMRCIIICILFFNSFSFCLQQLTNPVSQENSPLHHILLLPTDILFSIVINDQTRNVLQKTCHTMNQLFSRKKPIIELISHSLFHTSRENMTFIALNAAWQSNLTVLKTILQKTEPKILYYTCSNGARCNIVLDLLSVINAKAEHAAPEEKIEWNQISDLIKKRYNTICFYDKCMALKMACYNCNADLVEKELAKDSRLDAIWDALFIAIAQNSFECTEILARHAKNRFMAAKSSLPLNKWETFLNVLHVGIKSQNRAFDALIKCDCLNTIYLSYEGKRFSVLDWIKQRGPREYTEYNYQNFEHYINRYKKHGAKSFEELNPPSQPCVLL